MSLSQQLTPAQQKTNGAVLEKVILENDLAKLSPLEKVSHIKNICESLGLNPLTRPIQLIKFQGKEVMYMTKDSTEQLRKNNHVSIVNMENKILNGCYIVTSHATTPDGRRDAATGAISIDGLKGEALCNAMMKAETKAKRRVTLSICGLGFMDESEVDSMAGAKKFDHTALQQTHENLKLENTGPAIDEMLETLDKLITPETLQKQFKTYYKILTQRNDQGGLKRLIDCKDKIKSEIEYSEAASAAPKAEEPEITIDAATGEVV